MGGEYGSLPLHAVAKRRPGEEEEKKKKKPQNSAAQASLVART
jgi:hypothetical protein